MWCVLATSHASTGVSPIRNHSRWKRVWMCCVAASMNPAKIRNVWLGVQECHCDPEVCMIFMHVNYQVISVVTV